MLDSRELRDRLVSAAHPTGGWGYSPLQPGHLEPTCLSLLAIQPEAGRFEPAISSAVTFLKTNQHSDGTFRLQRGRLQATWPTAITLLTLDRLGNPLGSQDAGLQQLIRIHGEVVQEDPEVADMMDIDVRRIGWPWALATFSWVEPTTWAVIALRALGQLEHPRTQEGLYLLLDRAFEDGGINYGNRFVLGKRTDPIPTTTALMLIAIQGYEHPRIEAAEKFLLDATIGLEDLEHLSWTILALSLKGESAEVQNRREQLSNAIERATSEGRAITNYRLALAILALDSVNSNPFRLGLPSSPAIERSNSMPNFEPTPKEIPKRSVSEKLRGWGKNIVRRGIEALRPLPPMAGVHIAEAETYELDLKAILQSQFEHFRAMLPIQGKQVVLKPNLVEWHRDKVINTDPRFVEAVIEMFKAEGAREILVAEGPGHWRNVEFLVRQSGLGEVLDRQGVRFVDLNHDEPIKVPNLGLTTGLESLFLPKTVVEADVFVSLPKLKMHHWAGATLSLKNLFGIMPGICYGWPKNELHWRGIPNSIVDIGLTQTPHLAIVDGITAMEGDGPLNGIAKHLGVLVMGMDLVAVDATCCRLMRLPPERVPTLALGAMKKLGRLDESQIPQLGLSIESKAREFAFPPNVEKILMPEPVAS
jgi:uncharacterized protein (DUF362 family)